MGTGHNLGPLVLAALAAGAQLLAEVETEAWRKYNREKALRATLPLALAELADYARGCIKWLNNGLGRLRYNENSIPQLFKQALPKGLVSTLSSLIEASGDAETEALVKLLRDVQIQHSRWNGLVQAAGPLSQFTPPDFNDLARGIFDAARIYAQCEALMPFARYDGVLPGPIMADDIRKVLLFELPDIPEEVEIFIGLHRSGRER